LLAEEQPGFRTDLSATEASHKFTDKTVRTLNNKMSIGDLFCYLAESFLLAAPHVLA
jgi:hypothetical protein